MSDRDPISDALDQARGIGLLIEHLELDGKVHRCDLDGQRRGKKPGWYIGHLHRLLNGKEIVVGGFGVWSGDFNNASKFAMRGAGVDAGERERIKAEQKRLNEVADADRADRAREAAARAAKIWSGLPDEGRSAYLQRKKVGAYGLRFGRDQGIVVPLRNEAGLLVGLQFISGAGEKKFLTGTAKRGAWHFIGEHSPFGALAIAEGYSTAASVHMATGWPVAVAFDCGNLLTVAKALQRLYPDARLVFAGDDDHQGINKRTGEPENAGRLGIDVATKAIGVSAIFPRFEDPNGRTDWNDLHVAQGLEAVRDQLLAGMPAPAVAQDDADEKEGESDWGATLVLDKHSNLMPMTINVMTVLEHHSKWRGCLAYDEFSKRVTLRRDPPYWRKPGALRDTDEIEIAAWFGRVDTYEASIESRRAREACVAVAERFPFHPVKDYLRGLVWDETPRIDCFFADHCGSEQSPMTAGFAANFFIAAVARVMKPGCKADLMMVIEGEQGLSKSTMIAVLAGPGFYADIGQSPTDKDFYQAIQGCWIVEISEMASFAKAENVHIKRAVSVQIDRFRKSYGHHVEDFPRECIFTGTANNSDWQRDETGGRRYMPIWVNEINLPAIAAARDQLWAEAVVRFDAGEPWWILPDGAKEAQDERYVDDPWTEHVVRWLNGKGGSNQYDSGDPAPIRSTTIAEILWRALDVEIKKQGRSEQTRVGNILRRIGWASPKRKRAGAARVRVYVRPDEPKETA